MRLDRCLWILLAATMLAACSRFTVQTQYDRSAKFTSLHTYAWLPGPQPSTFDPRIDAPAVDERVRGAIARVLAKKGFRAPAEGKKPDFFVRYYIVLRDNTRNHEDNGSLDPDSAQSAEGTLQIDIIDAVNSKLIWRGAGAAVVDPNASVDNRRKRINAAVAQILRQFPPQPGVSFW